eukprot:GHVU01017292.1.p1 GENE.GHVU01017292.1~~GHVU01017292.1.p1  ORF type:complete len:199 (+),score=17.68 GHVU01017292.1:209-805(+)
MNSDHWYSQPGTMIRVEKSIFPSFDANTSFTEWKSEVTAIISLHKEKWDKEEVSEVRRTTIVGWNLVLASKANPRVRTNIQRVLEKKESAKFATEQEWVDELWATIQRGSEPLKRDGARKVGEDLENLTRFAQDTLQGNIPKLIEHFLLVRADAAKYETGHTDKEMALKLIPWRFGLRANVAVARVTWTGRVRNRKSS